jgi:hypothetical protein
MTDLFWEYWYTAREVNERAGPAPQSLRERIEQ